ncbi:hypothetical protein RND71_008914 [Anisodus tanguticus]|uniref:Uncharacterized protein n=1 Tax=Anisodus tanguticus TaxID=243964 RepID=A0AAE1SP72_9SOLA|nr:hypothetical protein RND71_008914 [Anisodus tanguticus]
MRPVGIISCILISLLIHELDMVHKYELVMVEARSLQYSSYNELFNSQHKVARELRSLDRNKGSSRSTLSPPKPNWRIYFSPPPRPPPPPPSAPSNYYP